MVRSVIVRVMLVVAVVAPSVAVIAPRVAHAADERPPHRHDLRWYSGWALVAGGAAVTLTGVGLTTQPNRLDGIEQPGLSAPAIAGWVMVCAGTATWIGGAVLLRAGWR
jgi:hypothetical protein